MSLLHKRCATDLVSHVDLFFVSNNIYSHYRRIETDKGEIYMIMCHTSALSLRSKGFTQVESC